MAPEFIFAEQVRQIIRSGEKAIEIPEGANISSAAADLIKEHRLRVKTIAPAAIAKEPPAPDSGAAASARKAPPEEAAAGPVQARETSSQTASPAELSEEEIEAIVNRVLERFQQLKSDSTEEKAPVKVDPEGIQDTDAADDDLIICRCEEITRGEIKEVIRSGIRTLNGIKRITRAGMGLCQGQTCQNLVARILAEELGLNPADIDPTTARGPVRPLPLAVFANS